jgi:hypothetical protein
LASGESRKLENGAFEPPENGFFSKGFVLSASGTFLKCCNNHRFVADPAQGHFESFSDNQLAVPRNARAILMHADNRNVDHLTALMGGSAHIGPPPANEAVVVHGQNAWGRSRPRATTADASDRVAQQRVTGNR